jgi:transglutaminase superfamily protein
VVILDLRAGDYLALDPTDSDLWEAVFCRQAGGAEAGALVDEVIARGWMESPESPQPLRRLERIAPLSPSASRAFIRLIAARLLVRHHGFATAYTWAIKRACSPRGLPTVPLGRASAAFTRAEHILPSSLGLHDCLPRSLALFVFLAEAGYEVTHCIGVKRFPFTGHAWVMADSHPVNADPEIVGRFTPIATIDSGIAGSGIAAAGSAGSGAAMAGVAMA